LRLEPYQRPMTLHCAHAAPWHRLCLFRSTCVIRMWSTDHHEPAEFSLRWTRGLRTISYGQRFVSTTIMLSVLTLDDDAASHTARQAHRGLHTSFHNVVSILLLRKLYRARSMRALIVPSQRPCTTHDLPQRHGRTGKHDAHHVTERSSAHPPAHRGESVTTVSATRHDGSEHMYCTLYLEPVINHVNVAFMCNCGRGTRAGRLAAVTLMRHAQQRRWTHLTLFRGECPFTGWPGNE